MRSHNFRIISSDIYKIRKSSLQPVLLIVHSQTSFMMSNLHASMQYFMQPTQFFLKITMCAAIKFLQVSCSRRGTMLSTLSSYAVCSGSVTSSSSHYRPRLRQHVVVPKQIPTPPGNWPEIFSNKYLRISEHYWPCKKPSLPSQPSDRFGVHKGPNRCLCSRKPSPMFASRV